MKKYIYSIIILVVGVGIFSYVRFYKIEQIESVNDISQTDTSNPTSTPLKGTPNIAEKISEPIAPPDGYIKYTNIKYSFSLYHSPEAKVTEYDQGQGAMIITVENEKKARGMQIFIVPYWEKEITNERFKTDVPSGVRTNIEKTSVDGVESVTFNSVDESLGDTREVWFIRGGYLYEVTTFKGVGDWFIPKMQTWRWI